MNLPILILLLILILILPVCWLFAFAIRHLPFANSLVAIGYRLFSARGSWSQCPLVKPWRLVTNQATFRPFETMALACLCLATVSCQETQRQHPSGQGRAGTQPGLMKSEFIYETAQFPQCHASTIAETKDGIVAAWFGGTHERHPDVGIWL